VKVARRDSEIEVAALVGRIVAGEAQAEVELVDRYSRGVNIIIDQIVRNAAVTEDLSQETFRIVIEKVRHGDLREPDRLSGFVCSVARNSARDHIRRSNRGPRLEEATGIEEIADPAPNQLDEILKQERARIVRQVISELSIDRDRQVLLLYFIAEEDKDAICQVLGITRIQFNYVIYRAIARFKDLLLRKMGEP
jgi:RNA polymerase sigma-70 factor (ECF subfamily)